MHDTGVFIPVTSVCRISVLQLHPTWSSRRMYVHLWRHVLYLLAGRAPLSLVSQRRETIRVVVLCPQLWQYSLEFFIKNLHTCVWIGIPKPVAVEGNSGIHICTITTIELVMKPDFHLIFMAGIYKYIVVLCSWVRDLRFFYVDWSETLTFY